MPTPHHDHSYKRLFSHREMVRDLLAGFVPQPRVAEADLSTLEPVKGSFITDDFREREDDIIWRVRLADGWLYVIPERCELRGASFEEVWLVHRMSAFLKLNYPTDLSRLSRNSHLGTRTCPTHIHKKRPGTSLPDINDYHEVPAVLQERVEQWNRQLIEQGRQEGRQDGRQEGQQEGRREAAVALLTRLLRRRFGPLPDWAGARLAAASAAELDLLTDAVLTAASLEEAFTPPDPH